MSRNSSSGGSASSPKCPQGRVLGIGNDSNKSIEDLMPHLGDWTRRALHQRRGRKAFAPRDSRTSGQGLGIEAARSKGRPLPPRDSPEASLRFLCISCLPLFVQAYITTLPLGKPCLVFGIRNSKT